MLDRTDQVTAAEVWNVRQPQHTRAPTTSFTVTILLFLFSFQLSFLVLGSCWSGS